MMSRALLCLIAALTLCAATAALAVDSAVRSSPVMMLRVTSGTAGHSIRFRGVMLLTGEPMRLVAQSTPFEFRSQGELTFAAFEPAEEGQTLTLQVLSAVPEPAMVTAPRVMVGHRIGGVASEFVQGY